MLGEVLAGSRGAVVEAVNPAVPPIRLLPRWRLPTRWAVLFSPPPAMLLLLLELLISPIMGLEGLVVMLPPVGPPNEAKFPRKWEMNNIYISFFQRSTKNRNTQVK